MCICIAAVECIVAEPRGPLGDGVSERRIWAGSNVCRARSYAIDHTLNTGHSVYVVEGARNWTVVKYEATRDRTGAISGVKTIKYRRGQPLP